MPFERGVGKLVTYEWDLEETDFDGDIFEHHFSDRLAELKDETPWLGDSSLCLVLVRTEGTSFYGDIVDLDDRTWAYLNDDGTFPEYFQNGAKVPKRLLKEFERNSEWASQYTNKQGVND
mgnify:CR=1 FL=1